MVGNEARLQRYAALQAYVGWTEEDACRVHAMAAFLGPILPALVDDFYAAILRHEGARRVLDGTPEQLERLKQTLLKWLRQLLSGPYDQQYVLTRWAVGYRHVEIGLEQVYTNVALSRLRRGLIEAIPKHCPGPPEVQWSAARSLDTLIDLDLALIEDAYQNEAAARLQAQGRLATLGQVAGGLAHELRNPLNVIQTSAFYLLNARAATPTKVEEHLRRIERHVGIADDVIKALSSFARLPMPERAPVDLSSLLQEILEIEPRGNSVTVVVDVPGELPRVFVDPAQMRIAIGNLIRNAIEAMPEGGRLTLIGSLKENRVELDVTDSGVGIAPDELSRIMEPLYSTKTRGLGLGLAICRSIVEKNGGALRAESQVGIGTTFTVRFETGTPSD